MQKGVCVSIIDLVTIRHANLYREVLTLIGCSDPSFPLDTPTCAVTCPIDRKTRLETWPHALHVGEPLPALPIWLNESSAVLLDLEACYEATCRVLRIA